jgi:NTP pyrophosphatase (non-canonical NTP hydrolase)
MTRTFTTLRAANAARQAEWDPDDRITLAYRGNEMGGECGEAQNVIKKLERERLGIRGSRATVQDLADELADVVICADLIAMAEGIDLDQAIARKFNLTSEKQGLETRLSLLFAEENLKQNPDDLDEPLRWFLLMIEAAGVEINSSEYPHNPINVFCDDRGDGTDTFNLSEDRGYTHTTHDSDFDISTTRLTNKGQEVVAVLKAA